jgi:hypothetical protein
MPLSSLSQGGDSLRGLLAALNGRYVALDLRSCTVGGETVITGIPGDSSNPRQYLVSLFLPEGITALGNDAFYLCSSLEYLSLPQTLTAIGNRALWDTAVRSLSVPQGVKSLGESAFEGSGLQSLDLSGLTLESMGDRILSGCSSLKQVILPENLPNNTLPDHTFDHCTALESVNLPRNLEIIGIGAFSSTAMSDMDLPPSLKTIGQYAFMGCPRFTPDIGSLTALETIGQSAFMGLSELTTLSLPPSITTLGPRAFEGCGNLTLAEIPPALVDMIDFLTFLYCRNIRFKVGDQEPSPLLIVDGALRAYPGAGAVGAVMLPEGIKEIPANVFQRETGITSISFPVSLETIGNEAFDGCTYLESVSIPADAKLKTLNISAFRGCTRLTAIDLPASLTGIDGYAFFGTTLLESVVCSASTPPTLGAYVFDRTYGNYEGLKIYIPDASVDAYKAADGWKDLSDKIYGLSSRP